MPIKPIPHDIVIKMYGDELAWNAQKREEAEKSDDIRRSLDLQETIQNSFTRLAHLEELLKPLLKKQDGRK